MTTAELQLPTTSGAIPSPDTMKALVYHGPGNAHGRINRALPSRNRPTPSCALQLQRFAGLIFIF
jgi:hypothetical protein